MDWSACDLVLVLIKIDLINLYIVIHCASIRIISDDDVNHIKTIHDSNLRLYLTATHSSSEDKNVEIDDCVINQGSNLSHYCLKAYQSKCQIQDLDWSIDECFRHQEERWQTRGWPVLSGSVRGMRQVLNSVPSSLFLPSVERQPCSFLYLCEC